MNDEELKTALKEYDRKKRIPSIIIVGGLVLLVIFAFVKATALLIISIVTFFTGILMLANTFGKKQKLISDNVTAKVLKDIFNTTVYDHKKHIGSNVVKSTGLISSSWNEIYGSDYFEGSYKGVGITCSDLKLLEVTTHSTGKSTYTTTTTVFEGQWIILKLKKPVSSKVIVREKSEKFFGSGYVKAKSDYEVEDVAFNEQYQIKSKDGHEVFHILTPHFMEHIKASDQKANGRTGFCFMNDEVHFICYNGRNLFEKYGSMNDIDEIRRNMLNDTKYITDMIDELLKNEYLFGTESEVY